MLEEALAKVRAALAEANARSDAAVARGETRRSPPKEKTGDTVLRAPKFTFRTYSKPGAPGDVIALLVHVDDPEKSATADFKGKWNMTLSLAVVAGLGLVMVLVALRASYPAFRGDRRVG